MAPGWAGRNRKIRAPSAPEYRELFLSSFAGGIPDAKIKFPGVPIEHIFFAGGSVGVDIVKNLTK